MLVLVECMNQGAGGTFDAMAGGNVQRDRKCSVTREAETDEPFAQLIGASALGFGAFAAAAPGVMAHVFGIEGSPEGRFLLRIWGLGSAQAGLELVLADGPVRTRLLMVAAAVDATGCALALRAGLPKRTTALIALTLGAVSAAAASGVASSSRPSLARG
ncbi:MAG: hypothetical protein ABJC79_09800 [Acidimicrobiia bacterium]